MEAERTSLGAMPYMTDNPNTAFVVRERVRNGELMQLKALIKEGIDFNECFLAPGRRRAPHRPHNPWLHRPFAHRNRRLG